jgi:hypothetical protein
MNLNANLWKITTFNENQNITGEGKAQTIGYPNDDIPSYTPLKNDLNS